MSKSKPPHLNINTIRKIENILLESLEFDEVVKKVVDSILTELGYLDLGYRIVVLTLVDKKKQVLKRISLSETKEARATLSTSEKNFHSIEIPLTYKKNASVMAINSKKPILVHDFKYILCPGVSEENALEIQQSADIKTSVVYPIKVKNKVIGTMIYSMVKYVNKLAVKEGEILSYFTDLIGIAVQNSLLYSDLQTRSKQLKKANKKLKDIDQRKDEFISIASHELKTPLAIVNTNLWMLSHISKNLDEKQKKFMHEMGSGLRRMTRVVNNLLDISRIEQDRFVLSNSEIDLVSLIQTTVSEFKPLVSSKGLNLSFDKPNFPIKVIVDKDRIDEVLGNFLSNANKYTEKGGIKVTVKERATTHSVRVAIADTGPGISRKDYDKIFTKFGRAGEGLKRSAVGASTGLGLYISKRIIEEMGGKVGFTSRLGVGSVFWFELPVVAKKQKTDSSFPRPIQINPTKEKIEAIKQEIKQKAK